MVSKQRNESEIKVIKDAIMKPQKTNQNSLSSLANFIRLYPENTRRPVNKTIFKNEYFKLVYNVKLEEVSIESRGDIIFSVIPYDTARSYIQRAAIYYLEYPNDARRYILKHKKNIEKYIKLSIFEETRKRVNINSKEFKEAYNAIFENPLFEIQIIGRLMQHDERGPISANIAGKFYYKKNLETGISEYVLEFIKFVMDLTSALPVITDGVNTKLLELNNRENVMIDSKEYHSYLTPKLDISPISELIIKDQIPNEERFLSEKGTPKMKSKEGKKLARSRKEYIAHSVHPSQTEKYFENVHSTENTNLLNVISDTHSSSGELPFTNKNFNILVGDISDSRVSNNEIEGIYIIGNHELADILPLSRKELKSKKYKPYLKYKWFKKLQKNPDESWPLLPVGSNPFYDLVSKELEKRFPRMKILHNDYIIHKGVRYVGLTVPVALVRRKEEQQKYILRMLTDLLGNDNEIPTVLVSHAPLFNELSMLSTKSKAYNKKYTCSEPRIEKIFKDYNIIGAVHGHHHIPASSGMSKTVNFAGKNIFVVCSIYSKINTGFELSELVNQDE